MIFSILVLITSIHLYGQPAKQTRAGIPGSFIELKVFDEKLSDFEPKEVQTIYDYIKNVNYIAQKYQRFSKGKEICQAYFYLPFFVVLDGNYVEIDTLKTISIDRLKSMEYQMGTCKPNWYGIERFEGEFFIELK